MKALLTVSLLIAVAASGQVVAPADDRTFVARDGVVEIYDSSGRLTASHAGVANPSAIAIGAERVAVLDSYANRLLTIPGGVIETHETPVAALFIGNDLYVLSRDARTLERIRANGSRTSVAVAADPVFMRESGRLLYVYSRLDGLVQAIDPVSMRVIRRGLITPFASDLEIDGAVGYLVVPREGVIQMFSLVTLEPLDSISAGSVPMDLAITAAPSTVAPVRLAVADPSSKRVWLLDGAQSVGGAFGRGFLRGLLGLGLYRPPHTDFPGGVDRVTSGGGVTLAYDSSTKTLYRVGKTSRAVVSPVGSDAFALFGRRIVYWSGGALRFAP